MSALSKREEICLMHKQSGKVPQSSQDTTGGNQEPDEDRSRNDPRTNVMGTRKKKASHHHCFTFFRVAEQQEKFALYIYIMTKP